MVDYIGVIKKPFRDLQTLLIGIIIGLIPVLNLLVIGYAVGAARSVLKGKDALPKWDPENAAQYIKDLVIATVIFFIYLIPALIINVVAGGVAIGGIYSGFISGRVVEATLAVLAGGLIALVALLFGVAGILLAAMAIMFYVKTGSITEAFNFVAILKKVPTPAYTGAVLAMIVYSVIITIIATIISGIVAIVPIVGWVVAPFLFMGIVFFILETTAQLLVAQVFKETP
ncbi:MAG TPA: DUF4013 domain-containing protein [archaeon]|nr:DUF4013 domain-containing protein [archaeon]